MQSKVTGSDLTSTVIFFDFLIECQMNDQLPPIQVREFAEKSHHSEAGTRYDVRNA